jgi:ubiquinone/menaquinone biosynthesis C-methylase UbiE
MVEELEMKSIEHLTGSLFSDLWHRYDDTLFKQSVALWEKRWLSNGEDPSFFRGKSCLDAGCGGGRYSIAMASMGASSVVGVDVGKEGLEDAQKRAAALGTSDRVTFQHASVLNLPFSDKTFDFVCCSGVLHHTPSVECGLRELHRVLKPGGSCYLLLYGSGGLYWPLNLVTRPFAEVLGKDEIERCIQAAGFPANKARTILDDFFVPILETYTRERIQCLLESSGFLGWRFWGGGHLDHESDPEVLLEELEMRRQMWEAGSKSSVHPDFARVELHLASLCCSLIDAALDLISQHKAGLLGYEQLRAAIIGNGHHRLIATRPHD